MKKQKLNILKNKHTKYPDSPDKSELEYFTNSHKNRDYVIRFNIPEFTSLCPVTGQPDFAHIIIDYIPDNFCIESKSLKLYIFSFRNHGTFHETAANLILDKIVKSVNPKWCRVTAFFYRRGGISLDIFAEHGIIPEGCSIPPVPKSYESGRIFQ